MLGGNVLARRQDVFLTRVTYVDGVTSQSVMSSEGEEIPGQALDKK